MRCFRQIIIIVILTFYSIVSGGTLDIVCYNPAALQDSVGLTHIYQTFGIKKRSIRIANDSIVQSVMNRICKFQPTDKKPIEITGLSYRLGLKIGDPRKIWFDGNKNELLYGVTVLKTDSAFCDYIYNLCKYNDKTYTFDQILPTDIKEIHFVHLRKKSMPLCVLEETFDDYANDALIDKKIREFDDVSLIYKAIKSAIFYPKRTIVDVLFRFRFVLKQGVSIDIYGDEDYIVIDNQLYEMPEQLRNIISKR